MKFLTEDELYELAREYMEDNFTGRSQKAFNKEMDAFMTAAMTVNHIYTQIILEEVAKENLQTIEELLTENDSETK